MAEVSVTPLDRGSIRTDLNHIVEGYSLASAADPDPEAPLGEGPVYNLVVDHPEATILWDTGSHPDAGDGYWPPELYAAFEHYDADEHRVEDDLAAAGYGLDDVDAVIQSHLHMDHAGGLYAFEGRDVPVYVHEEEVKYAYYCAKTDEGSHAYIPDDFDRDLDWRVVHRDRQELLPGIELFRLPGHTPGLMGMRLDTADGTLLVAGDEAYVRENYDEEIPLGAGLLHDKRRWFDSLRTLKELERRHDATVICGHDADDLARLRER